MYLNKYKKLNSFEKQKQFLLNNFGNQNKRYYLLEDMKKNITEYLLHTKFIESQNFNCFYNIIKLDNELLKNFNDNLLTILNYEHIDLLVLYEILNTFNYNTILNDELIQNKLIKLINNNYQYGSLKIINKFIKKENRKKLLLNQIKFRINELVNNDQQDLIYNFVIQLIKDPMFKNIFIYKASGSYKDCFILGDYILKIGVNAQKINMSDFNNFKKNNTIKSNYFLSPILYKTFGNLVISIYPQVKVPSLEEERNQCWFNIRDEHIIVYDSNNILNYGKVTTNIIHPYKNISENGKKFLGINNFMLRDFMKNETVCIDYDFSISEDDNSLYAISLQITFYYEFSKLNNLYLKEKAKNLRKVK